MLTHHGPFIRTHARTHATCLRAVQKAVSMQHEALGKMSNGNVYGARFLLHRAKMAAAAEKMEADGEGGDVLAVE